MFKKKIVQHPDFDRATKLVRECHESAKDGLPVDNLKVLGPSGSGKTTVLTDYRDVYPRYEEHDRMVVPVLYTRIPSRPTIKKVVARMLRDLGSKYPEKGDEGARTYQLLTLLRECRTELLLVDEVQHLVDRGGKKTHALIADWLKEVVDEFGGACVVAGLTRAQLLDAANEQFARRFSSEITLEKFEPATEDGVEIIRGVQQELCANYKVALAPSIDEADLAARVAYATDGIMGYIIKMFAAAARRQRRPPTMRWAARSSAPRSARPPAR